jgi:predicted transposase/invertase (TIGR01784 family)
MTNNLDPKKDSSVNCRNLIRFDWAIKRLLRQKANYKVLEGFLSELLREDVSILNISDSESNKTHADDKFNRVDILVENVSKELYIIEMQNSSEADYFLRMLYGVSKVITEYMKAGEKYQHVRKVYSINIVYFELGHGTDYIYHGFNEFYGLHHNDVLQLTDRQQKFLGKNNLRSLYPEYYILKVKDFDNIAKDTLDEWIYYLKNNDIPESFAAKGLDEARKLLQYDALSKDERKSYLHYVDQTLYEQNAIETSRGEGEDVGFAKGLAKGKAEGKAEGERLKTIQVIEKSRKEGFSIETIAAITGLSSGEVESVLSGSGVDEEG